MDYKIMAIGGMWVVGYYLQGSWYSISQHKTREEAERARAMLR